MGEYADAFKQFCDMDKLNYSISQFAKLNENETGEITLAASEYRDSIKGILLRELNQKKDFREKVFNIMIDEITNDVVMEINIDHDAEVSESSKLAWAILKMFQKGDKE